MRHELKIHPQYFKAVESGRKYWEIRKNDRDFKVGDEVLLREWDNTRYSGEEILAEITYMLDDKFAGLAEGYVVFSIKPIKR